MNHVPGEGQYSSPEAFSKRYKAAPDEAVGVKTEAPIEDLIQSRGAVAQPIVDRHRDAVVAAARSADVPVASHDDVDEKAVDRAANHGVDICEFPVTLEAARRAGERDMTVAMGAPNLVRGGSLWGNLDASVALEAGLVDILCSDFRPQTLLKSIFSDSGDSVHECVARVSSKPARAVGLNDRGRLESGARADVIVVDPEPSPTVSRVFVAGDEVYRFNSH
jgi:alpha-D-ribose 1-methylphosphonate 5-triphosphate diphosphatase